MRTIARLIVFCAVFLSAATLAAGQRPEGTMAFTVSMEQPATHIYHVVFRYEGLKSGIQDFRMPVWSPGYYGIFDFAKNVQNDGNVVWREVPNHVDVFLK